ncbi:MAG: hypothetical protein ABSB50_14060 [Terracidiphilus sp.]|jgi:hypothetical protein
MTQQDIDLLVCSTKRDLQAARKHLAAWKVKASQAAAFAESLAEALANPANIVIDDAEQFPTLSIRMPDYPGYQSQSPSPQERRFQSCDFDSLSAAQIRSMSEECRKVGNQISTLEKQLRGLEGEPS